MFKHITVHYTREVEHKNPMAAARAYQADTTSPAKRLISRFVYSDGSSHDHILAEQEMGR
jgi:hypothetical protein